jgi:hypothetical protein
MYLCVKNNHIGFAENWLSFTVLHLKPYREVSEVSLCISDGFNWIGSTVRFIAASLGSCGSTLISWPVASHQLVE